MKGKANKNKEIGSLLAKKIEAVYQQQLKQELKQISYKLFDRALVITLEGVVTSPEKLLKDNDRTHLAKEVRKAVDDLIYPQIEEIIEEVLGVKIVDFLSDTTIEHNITGAIAIFEFNPKNI